MQNSGFSFCLRFSIFLIEQKTRKHFSGLKKRLSVTNFNCFEVKKDLLDQ